MLAPLAGRIYDDAPQQNAVPLGECNWLRLKRRLMQVYRLKPIPPDRDPQVREMIGLAKGFICDGCLNDAEALALREWLVGNSRLLDTSPATFLGERLLKAFDDGAIDDTERQELTAILIDVTKLA